MTKLKYFYTNLPSTGSKHEELQATLLLESCDLITIAETLQEDSHNWSSLFLDVKRSCFPRVRKQARKAGGKHG